MAFVQPVGLNLSALIVLDFYIFFLVLIFLDIVSFTRLRFGCNNLTADSFILNLNSCSYCPHHNNIYFCGFCHILFHCYFFSKERISLFNCLSLIYTLLCIHIFFSPAFIHNIISFFHSSGFSI